MFSLVLFSCTKENPAEFNQKTTEAHKIEFTEVTVPESGGNIALTLDVSSQTEGVLFYAVSNVELATPDAYQLISGNIAGMYNGYYEVTSINHIYNDTIQGFPKYYVYSVIRNINDEITPVVVDTVVVNDVTSPYLLSDMSNPVSGSETVTSPVIELAFNEPVFLSDTFKMEVIGVKLVDGDLPDVETSIAVTKDMVSINSNIVTIDLSNVSFNCGNMVVVSSVKGSFVDESNNESVEIKWVHDGSEFTSIDYYFDVKNFDFNETMLSFLGENTLFTFINGKMSGSARTHNVELMDCSESTALLVGVFGVHNNLEFEFNIDNGTISFENFETAIYYDEELGEFKVGDPTGLTQKRVYYKPEVIGDDGECGKFTASNKTFYVSYGIYIGEFSNIGTVVDNYSKNASMSSYSAKASSMSSTNSSVDYLKMIKEFRE